MGSFPARQTKHNFKTLLSDFANFVDLAKNNTNLTNKFFQLIGCGPLDVSLICVVFSNKTVCPRDGPEVTVGCLGVFITHNNFIWSLPGPIRTQILKTANT